MSTDKTCLAVICGHLRHLWIAVAFAVAVSACATPAIHGEPMVETRLYFGMRIDEKTEVSDAQWREFLDTDVTPRFQDGFTVLQAYGQWRDHSNAPIVREPSRVLVIVHSGDADRAISTIVAAYKSKFRQMAVLRVDTAAGVDFYAR